MKFYYSMAGLYVHIPFCRQACHYCDFHFTVSLKNLDSLVHILNKELKMQKNYLEGEQVNSIYFGGGTPSLLSPKQLDSIINTIYKNYNVKSNLEFTLEANPEDIDDDFLKYLKDTTVNRLSLGIQSFHDEDLHFLNRIHSAHTGEQAIIDCKLHGFNNLNIDLIYGFRYLSIKKWRKNLHKLKEYDIPHFSAYHLTIEKKTVFNYFIKKGQRIILDEKESIRQFEELLKFSENNNFIHYEISNFSKKNLFSTHNIGYWSGENYLGIGPSAHSYNGKSRRWNVAINKEYIHKINAGSIYYEQEALSKTALFNEYLMTRLRTMWGIDIEYIRSTFGEKYLKEMMKSISGFINSGKIEVSGNYIKLNTEGKKIADYIIGTLFRTE